MPAAPDSCSSHQIAPADTVSQHCSDPVCKSQISNTSHGSSDSSPDLAHKLLEQLEPAEAAFLQTEGQESLTAFLLQCLQYANKDLEQAVHVAQKFCQFRLEHGWPLLFKEKDVDAELRSHVHWVLPSKDRDGRTVLVFNPGNMDFNQSSPAEYQRMLCYILQEITKSSEAQHDGMVLLVDTSNAGVSMVWHCGVDDFKRGVGMLSGAYPCKCKSIYILRPGKVVSAAMKIATPLMSEKMQERIKFIDSSEMSGAEWAAELIPTSDLPVELGGNLQGMRDKWLQWVDSRATADTNEPLGH